MANVLYLVHRLPYPPNKGDKVRSYHLLRHLAERHCVHLGTFLDDPADEVHIDTLRSWCASVHVARLNPTVARVASLRGLLTVLQQPFDETLEFAAYAEPALASESAGYQTFCGT